MQKERNLFRIDTGNTHGWQVRIERNKTLYSKFFSDSLFEAGAEGAFRAAQKRRDSWLEELPPIETDRVAHLHSDAVRAKMRAAVTRTGVNGIGFSMKRKKNSPDRTPYVQAYWTNDKGQPRGTSFSVERHGGRGALRLAARALLNNSDVDIKEDTIVRKAWPNIRALLEEEGYNPYKGKRQ